MKITRFQGDEERPPDWPWWTLVEAIVWIVGEEDPDQPSDVFGGDMDYGARRYAASLLRTALARGTVTAYGLRSYSEKPDRLEPVDWNTREIPITEFRGVTSWQLEPYSDIVVAKDEIMRIWPVPLASEAEEPRKSGRPEEYDWARILRLAEEERRSSPSARKLEMIIQARCQHELGYPEGKPSIEAIRYQLKKVRNKSP